jgi:PPIC-type PPIASE domain
VTVWRERAGVLGALLVGQLAGLSGCGRPAVPESPVLATWDGGQVDRQDLDRLISSLPLEHRRPEGGDFRAWHRDWVRELAARRILLVEAERQGAGESADFRSRLGELRRSYIVNVYLREHLPQETEVTSADLESYLQEHGSSFSTPERRMVFHIFLRSESAGDRQQLLERAADLRRRAIAGERFAALAERYSDSELRYRQGLLGWVRRGELSPDLEEVVFSLPERQPSEPLATRDGVHLFWVETALAAQSLELEDARGALTAGLRHERLAQAVDRILGDEMPADAFVPDAGELATLISRGTAQTLVLRIGGYELHLGELREMLATAGASRPEEPLALVQSITRRERLYLRAEADGLAGRLEDDPGLAALREAELLRSYRGQRLEAFAGAQEDRLQEYFSVRRGNYTTPLRLRLRMLTVPLPEGDAAGGVAARLERAAGRAADGGGQETAPLEDLARETGGRVEDLGWVPGPQFAAFGQVGSLVAGALSAGEISGPFRVGGTLRVLQAVEREEPQPLTWEAARERVVRDLLQEDGLALYREMVDALLREHRFGLDEAALDGLSPTAE